MRKCLFVVLLVVFSMIFCSLALAESPIIISNANNTQIEQDKTYSIDSTLEFTVGKPEVADKLGEYGEESGERNQFVIVPISVLNTSFDEFLIENMVKLTLIYKDNYIFEPYSGEIIVDIKSYFIGLWRGVEFENSNKNWLVTLQVSEIDDAGVFRGIYEVYENTESSSSKNTVFTVKGTIDFQSNYIGFQRLEWINNPNNWSYNNAFKLIHDQNSLGGVYGSDLVLLTRQKTQLSSDENMLGMLEEDTVSYIFKVPNAVVNDAENAIISLVIEDVEYTCPLQ